MTLSVDSGRPRAVLVGIQLPGVSEEEHNASLAELGRLVDTLGFDVVGQVSQKRTHLSSSAGLGGGKLKELAHWTGGTGVVPSGAKKKIQRKEMHKPSAESMDDDEDEVEDDDFDLGSAKAGPKATVVVVDNELSPSQIRNLERSTGVEVLDRAGVIIEIFWRHARTKEAQMQVEIARLTYEAPRLREKESSGDRQRGGGVGGKGDNQLEIDRHRIRDRIAELKEKLEEILADADNRRQRRSQAMRVALVGYTNAGKSSLMRALTGSEVLVADKLFATLGTTMRAIPHTHPKVLISDTVGFIKNLPHSLVASFKSTLDEAHDASLLLFVVDASDANFRSQLEVTKTVLAEIGAESIPRLLILNKIDRVEEAQRKKLKREFKDAIQLSALDPDDVARMRKILEEHFHATMDELALAIPFAKTGHVLSFAHENARVVSEAWDEDGLKLKVRAPKETLERLQSLASG